MMILSGLVDAQATVDDPPTPEELAGIQAGRSIVKICRNDERFWVVVTRVLAKRVVGTVDNHLVYNKDLPAGTEVAFEKRHIYAIDTVQSGSPAVCPDCGEPIHEEEFAQRADALFAALDGIDDASMELTLIAMLAGEFLAKFPAEDRRGARKMLIKAMDLETKDAVVSQCDA